MQDLFNKATALHQQGSVKEAAAIYIKILEQSPEHPVVLSRLAAVYQQMGQLSDAVQSIKTALANAPGELELLTQGAALASQAGENSLAEAWLLDALNAVPDDVKLNEQLAGVYIANHKEEQALEIAKKVIRLDPKNANAYNLKGLALSRLGQTEKGYTAFQKAVKLNPGLISVIRNLVLYNKGKKDPLLDSLIPQLEQNFLAGGQPAQVQMNIAYILSMYFEKKKQTEKMFKFLQKGNQINRASYQYDHSQTESLFASIQTVFNDEFLSAYREKTELEGGDAIKPIFILGMPRSGTTLIEQILSSHSLVEAEGEILDLRESFDANPQLMSSSSNLQEKIQLCEKVGAEYIASVGQRQKAQYFTDKMPYNFMMLGAIALAIPGAKIIHCTRDPLETCFSIYKQNFAGSHAYTNDLVELGKYYKSYQSLMSFWEEKFPGQIYTANYESMVANSEQEITKLLEFCELEKQDACYKFYQNKRAVRTASVAQVRQPIYKDAVKASEPYKAFLGPLIDALQ